MCSLSVGLNIRILSKYATVKWSKQSDKTSFIRCWKDAGALQRPKGITQYSKCPYLVWKAVFHSSPSAIHIRLYAPLRSIFVKYLAVWNWSNNSLIKGRGYLFFTVTLFNPW
jgi:hypothetical protein